MDLNLYFMLHALSYKIEPLFMCVCVRGTIIAEMTEKLLIFNPSKNA